VFEAESWKRLCSTTQRRIVQYDLSELEVAKAGVALYNWVVDAPESPERTAVIRGVQDPVKL
jgi:hypothetical protein